MIRFFSLLSAFALFVASCSGSTPTTAGATLKAPEEVTAQTISQEYVIVSWKNAAPTAEGFYVFRQSNAKPESVLPKEATSYRFDDLEPGTEYRFGVQAFGSGTAMSSVVWLQAVKTLEYPPVPEPEPEPEEDPNPIEAIEFTWSEVTGMDLPASLKVYRTEGTLSGRPLQAWYAEAKTNADVQLRVLFPGLDNKKTIDAVAEADEKCLILVNGGIFGQFNNGLAVCDGQQTPWARVEDDNWNVDRQYWGPDGKLHTISRGLFGVDAAGTPGVYWSYTPSHGTVYVYDKPIPTVAGGPVQGGGTDTFPCPKASWEPYNAITCGPVLLQGGKCPINDKKTPAGYWETNYELWADDIYGVEVLADRTAVGYREDGSVILLIVDGRISTSQGATTLEMAAIMKGLGCVGALNLDGGGSTGMWVRGGGHLNDLTGGNRAVLTTIGLFSK